MKWKTTGRQGGFIASYILYGIGLLAIIGAAYGHLSTAVQQVEQVQKTVDEITAQVEILKGKIMLCAAVYPDGDHGQFNARHAYPAPATAGNQQAISAVTCPTPGGPLELSRMPDGVPVPVAPPDFNEWVYEHTLANGIRLRLVPRSAVGNESVKNRIGRQFPGSVVEQDGQLIFEILK